MSNPAELAKVFMSGRSQAVRLPKSCRFQGTEVYARRVGHSVVLSPKTDDWAAAVQALFAELGSGADLKRSKEWTQRKRDTLV